MEQNEVIQTGLRAIDVLAPIPLGGDILVSGDPKAGVRLLAQEIAQRLANHPLTPFRVTFFIDEALPQSDQVLLEINESSSKKLTAKIVQGPSFSELLATDQPTRKGNEAFFAVSSEPRFFEFFRHEIRSLRARSTAHSVTSFAIIEGGLNGDFDAQLISSRTVAEEGIYPALDTRRTTSNRWNASSISEGHRQLATRIKRGLDETIENLYLGAISDDNWFFNKEAQGRPWVQLLCFLSQGYFVAEPYTGLKAAFIPLASSIEAMESILNGELANVPAPKFRYKNDLSEL